MHWVNFVNFSYKQKQHIFTNNVISNATVSPKCKMIDTTLGTAKQASLPSQKLQKLMSM